jgi:hypothetical protein
MSLADDAEIEIASSPNCSHSMSAAARIRSRNLGFSIAWARDANSGNVEVISADMLTAICSTCVRLSACPVSSSSSTSLLTSAYDRAPRRS